MSKKGFTLLELLVVVLIIGILAAIALPQYQMAVEKSKSAEALMNIATMKKQIELYTTANGVPNNVVRFEDFSDVELSGGEWNNHIYKTKNFEYWGPNINNRGGGEIEVDRCTGRGCFYVLYCTQFETNYNNDSPMNDGWYCSCVTQLEDDGRKMCKLIYEPLGFKYIDGEI